MAIMKEEKPVFSFALTEQVKKLNVTIDGKSLKPTDWLPSRANESDTGYDVRVAQNVMIQPFSYFKIPLGIVALIPEGWWLQLSTRSSSFIKKHLHNLYGVIDQDFPHELHFVGQYITDRDELIKEDGLLIPAGERIGQLIPIRRIDMDVKECSLEFIDEQMKFRSATRTGGFGSSGKL